MPSVRAAAPSAFSREKPPQSPWGAKACARRPVTDSRRVRGSLGLNHSVAPSQDFQVAIRESVVVGTIAILLVMVAS